MDYDVLIVGGGPAGLSCAAQLPVGMRCLIVHQDKEIGRPVRTSGGSWVRDLQNIGVPPEFYQTINEIEIRSDNQRSLHHMQDHKMAVLDITGLYQWLAGHARRAGAEIWTGAKFLTTSQGADGFFTSDIRLSGNESRSIRSKYVVDASGTPRAVMQSLGLGARAQRVGVGIEYEYEIEEAQKDRASLFVGAPVLQGYGWIFPAPNNHIRIGVGVIQPDTDVSPRDMIDPLLTPEFLQSYGLKLGERLQVNAGIIPSEPYEKKVVFGRAIRVGDSANVATPTVGEGIRLAIELGGHLGQCLKDCHLIGADFPLKAYERQATRRFHWQYKFGFWANQKIASYGPEDWDKSIARVARLDEAQLAALIRCELTPTRMISAAYSQVKSKLQRA
ncbi:NAD(P)/FAD-dependent oxidoreductase [Tropicibacter sp. R15_0]|uniref:NAD(P)/FAD-dependent oxidoreductase n=1 Tax=Tropicibacter sp. R15_0 TaxID=2821101 RepID=UPI001ADACF91|nr:NAD(P)/FAD-dependent oxidoreductase [Tropicibacter sp. R15_0]MBO9466751.1 NAD(P)/FAD-dependent oxidoreductase [Tropicibacter sp. R15_0]